jgi:hypothetical protein
MPTKMLQPKISSDWGFTKMYVHGNSWKFTRKNHVVLGWEDHEISWGTSS